MKILKEITEWQDNIPNHVYHVTDAGKLIAYQIRGEGELITLKHPLTFSRTGRKFITLKTIKEEKQKPKGPAIKVKGSKGTTYYITNGKCSCPGFSFRGKCKHIENLK